MTSTPSDSAAPHKPLIREMALGAGLLVVSIGLSIMALEVLYRMQIVDTYAPELYGFNPPEDLATSDGRPTVLVMGDSFTAGLGSYPSILRVALPAARIVNAGISGTGIVQTAFVAKKRFARFRPTVFVYQIYVGNDLFDITYPVNWKTISPLRNIYWLVANHLRSLGFVNYRLGQLGYELGLAGTDHVDSVAKDQPFSPALYTRRALIDLRADPRLIEESALVKGSRTSDFSTLVDQLRSVLGLCVPEECTAFVLVIPQCAQVTAGYLQNMRKLGAIFDDQAALQSTEYPFVAQLRGTLSDLSNVTVLNPIGVLRASELAGVPVYHSNDNHLNEAGQAVMAAVLAPNLASSLGVAVRSSSHLSEFRPAHGVRPFLRTD